MKLSLQLAATKCIVLVIAKSVPNIEKQEINH